MTDRLVTIIIISWGWGWRWFFTIIIGWEWIIGGWAVSSSKIVTSLESGTFIRTFIGDTDSTGQRTRVLDGLSLGFLSAKVVLLFVNQACNEVAALSFLALVEEVSVVLALSNSVGVLDADNTVISLVNLEFVENTTHDLDLGVLYVNDFLADDGGNALWIGFDCEVVAVTFSRDQESLAHIHSVLVMRNHLMVEETDSVWLSINSRGGNIGGHTGHHGTVHRVNTASELSNSAAGLVTGEGCGTVVVGELELFETKSTTRLVVCAGYLVIIRDLGRVIRGDGISCGVNELDTSTHEVVDVAEVEEVSNEVIVSRVTKKDIPFASKPVKDGVEKLWFVGIKSEIFSTLVGCFG